MTVDYKALAPLDAVALPKSGLDIRALIKSLHTQSLYRANGNRTRASKLLGLHRDHIRYSIKKHGLEDLDYGEHTHSGRFSSVTELLQYAEQEGIDHVLLNLEAHDMPTRDLMYAHRAAQQAVRHLTDLINAGRHQ